MLFMTTGFIDRGDEDIMLETALTKVFCSERGFEAVNVRSGYTHNGLGAYTEYRDNHVVFFVRRLARGDHSVSYRMRAEIPGRFSALPTQAAAMYAPELKANSDEIKLKVKD